MSYTKGPWHVVEANTPGVLYISGPAQTLTIITTAIDLDFADYVKRTSDAHLIAAAPDLLGDLIEAAATLRRYEALHLAKGTDDSTAKAKVNADLATRFEATIAKAKGDPA